MNLLNNHIIKLSNRQIIAYLIIFLTFFNAPSKLVAENKESAPALAIDEVLVVLYVKNLGTCEIPTAIQGQDIYLPVVDVFNFLKIRAIAGNGFDVVSGFFIDPQNTYQIDRVNNLIIYQGKTIALHPSDIIVTETNLYLKAKYFQQIFGLECKFNYRTLTISLKSALELPAIREMRLEQMHANLDRLKSAMKADTTIARTYPLFHFGMADWTINANQSMNGINNTVLSLGLGAIVAGGELNSLLYYNPSQPFSEKQQYYLWRYANNENKAVKQFMLGKIATSSVSSIFRPVVGLQFTNAPTVNRKSFGTYTLNSYTKPNWTVELYVNGILIDYVKADASGFFTFNVPLIYGSTDVSLRYYGPWGEELSSKQSFNIPFNFLPPKEMEYKISSGIIEDNKNSLFGQARMNYGLTKTITLGGGLEYNSSIATSKNIAFFNTSIRMASNVLFNGEYIYGVRYKGLLTYHLPSDFQMELYYSKYNPGQQAIRLNYTEERRMMISKSFRLLSVSAFSHLILSQNLIQNPDTDLPPTKYTIPEFSLSVASHRISLNITTSAFILDKMISSVFSDAALSLTLPGGILFTPQVRFDYKLNEITLVKYSLEKRFVKYGVLDASYQNNRLTNSPIYQIGFRYDFPYARIGISALQSNNINSLSEFASGSLIYQPQINYVDINVNTNVGRGGLIFIPFLDINNNGKKDANEPKVSGINVMVSGGGIQKSRKDTTIVISGLEPYTNYFVEADANGVENMAWRIKKPKMNIAIEPNKLKLIEIPISILGEVSGTVFIKKKNKETGLGRILVGFYDQDSVLINKTLTEPDGYFSFLGLFPGSYYAKIDSGQLNKLQMISIPSILPYRIKSNIDGDVVDDLKFIIQSKAEGTTKSISEQPEIKTVSPPQISDTLSTILALMVKKHADSLRMANQQKDVKVINPPQISDTLSNPVSLAAKKYSDSIKIGNKEPEIKTLNPPKISDTLSGLLALMVQKKNDSIKLFNNQQEIQLQEKTRINEPGIFEVQARAHSQLSDAKATQSKLSKIFKQPVVIVNEGGLYKVRITGFINHNAAMAIIPILDAHGFPGAFIISPAKNTGNPNLEETSGWKTDSKAQEIKDVPVNKNDITKVVPDKGSENSIINEKGIYAVQAMAHSKLSDAKITQSKLSKIFKQPIIIVNEGGLYKVRISGLENHDDATKLIPKLEKLGFDGAFIISPSKNKTTLKQRDPLNGNPSMDILLGVLNGKIKSERGLSKTELTRIEEMVVTKNNVIKRSKFGDEGIYTIQIASHEEGLSQSTLAVVYKLQTEVESYANKGNNITTYFTGSYRSYNSAEKAKNSLVKKGFINPIVIVIYKGKIISVKEYNKEKIK